MIKIGFGGFSRFIKDTFYVISTDTNKVEVIQTDAVPIVGCDIGGFEVFFLQLLSQKSFLGTVMSLS